jgi:hypothetical protein
MFNAFECRIVLRLIDLAIDSRYIQHNDLKSSLPFFKLSATIGLSSKRFLRNPNHNFTPALANFPSIYDPNTTNPSSVIYVLCSHNSKKIYVGQSTNPYQRFQKHIREIKNNTDELPCYPLMHRIGPSSWFMLPIATTTPDNLRKLEQQYIHRLRPPLNFYSAIKYNPAFSKPVNRSIRARPSKNKRRPPTNSPPPRLPPTSTSFSLLDNSRTFSSLTSLIQFVNQHNTRQSFSVTYGQNSHTNMFFVKKLFPSIIITHLTSLIPLTTFLQQIKSHTISQFSIYPCTPSPSHSQSNIKLLTHLAKHPHAAKKQLRTLDSLTLISFTHIAQHLPTPLNTLAYSRLSSELKTRHISITKPLSFSIPAHHHFNREPIRRLINRYINQLQLPRTLFILTRHSIRVSFKKFPSIGDYLVNHIQFAKNFSLTPPPCTCKQFQKFMPTIDGHVCCRGTDITGPYKKFLSISSRNIPHPTVKQSSDLVIQAFHEFHALLSSYLKPFGIKTPPPPQSLQALIRKLYRDPYQRKITINLLTPDPSMKREQLFSAESILQIRKRLRTNLVIGDTDHNIGSLNFQ